MPSIVTVNRVKSYIIDVAKRKQKYIDAGVIAPAQIDYQLMLLVALEQCLYIDTKLNETLSNKLGKTIKDVANRLRLNDVPIYTFKTSLYMKYMITPPANRTNLFTELLERIVASGISILDDCSKGCDNDTRILFTLYNVFIAAMAADDIGEHTAANVMYEHIIHKLRYIKQ